MLRYTFDLADECPFRMWLLRTGDEKSVLAILTQDIAVDRWSLHTIVSDPSAAYGAVRRKGAHAHPGTIEPVLTTG